LEYFLAFLEGIITFISPCLLPMLPIYISYFAGGDIEKNEKSKHNALRNSLGFVAGFTTVFILLGIFAATLGRLLSSRQNLVNIVSGLIVIIFGLNFMGILKIPLLNRTFRLNANVKKLGFASSFLFGVIFSVGWTPCVGAFLGSALMLVSQQNSILKGVLMMLCYSAGLGIPFVFSAVLIEQLQSAFDFIKKHYKIINIFSGALLVAVGVLMMLGYMNYFLSVMR